MIYPFHFPFFKQLWQTMKKNLVALENLHDLFVIQIILHQHLVLVGHTAVVCIIVPLNHLYQIVRDLLATALIQRSIGFTMIDRLQGLLLLSQSPPSLSLQLLNTQFPSQSPLGLHPLKVLMFLDKQPLPLSI